MRIKKFLSAKCPVWSGICLSSGRRRRLYCCFAVVGGGSSPCRTWLEFFYDFSEQPIIAFLHQLNKVWQIRRTVTTSLTAAEECVNALGICTSSKSNPRWRCVYQTRNDCPENRPETILAKTEMPQHSQCIERLHTAADYTSDMVRCRQCAGKRDAEHFQRWVTDDVGQRRRRLDMVSTPVVIEHDFPCLGLVKP